MPMASRLPRTARLPLLTSFLVLLLTPICDSFSSSAMGSSRILKPRLFSRTCEPSRAPGQGVRGLHADVTVSLPTPLGIVFEEVEPGQSSGLVVADLVRARLFCSDHTGRAILVKTTDALGFVSRNALSASFCAQVCRCQHSNTKHNRYQEAMRRGMEGYGLGIN